ncbi:MAG: ATP-binding protein, partial [Candidatus Micrarchaeota archaeon]
FYYSFDLAKEAVDIERVLVEYLDSASDEKGRHLFLDEATAVSDWQKAVKLLVDRGDMRKDDCVLVTGSSAVDLRKGSERLPGRGIEGKEYFYLPCCFNKYLQLKGVDVETHDPMDAEAFCRTADRQRAKLLTLNKHFASYLKEGGFLYSMNHGGNDAAMERYARWLEGDFVKSGKSPIIAKEIVQAVIRKGCSQFSYHSIAKETSAVSHNTIIDYLGTFSDELFLRTAGKASIPFKPERRKEKKAYFLDPLLAGIAERWAGMRMEQACLVEQVVMSHISRIAAPYFYNDGRKEIDCIARIGSKTIGIEVKWSNNLSSTDAYAVRKADVPYLLSKETIEIGKNGIEPRTKEEVNAKVPVLPVSLFLSMLDAREILRRNVLAME